MKTNRQIYSNNGKQNRNVISEVNVKTYDARLKMIKIVTIAAANDLYINLHDAANLLQSRRFKECEIHFDIYNILEKVDNYIENLNHDETLTLEDINKANAALDNQVAEVYKFISLHDSLLGEELKGGITRKIKNTGYVFIFDEKKMSYLWEEKNFPKYRQNNKQINEEKAIKAMFSNCYSPEVRNEMIDVLKTIEQQ